MHVHNSAQNTGISLVLVSHCVVTHSIHHLSSLVLFSKTCLFVFVCLVFFAVVFRIVSRFAFEHFENFKWKKRFCFFVRFDPGVVVQRSSPCSSRSFPAGCAFVFPF